MELVESLRAANDPKRTSVTGYQFAIQLLYLGHQQHRQSQTGQKAGTEATSPRFLREATERTLEGP